MGHYYLVKYYFLLCAVCILTVFNGCSSKKGCIDPGSISFDPDAKIDDGSCTYPSLSLTPTLARNLANVFSETSGIKYKDSRVWTIVDEVGENKIYSIDLLSGDIREVLAAAGLSSVDFEAVTASPSHFFIGDIGNNEGNRTDLTIYKIPKPAAYNPVNQVSYEIITFTYPEQTDFRKNSNTNFDAESLMYYGDKLYLLTKNHENNKTSLYEIPAIAGDYEAKIRGVFDTKGLITDADISPSGTKMVMIGYNKDSDKTFVWILKDFSAPVFFSGKKTLVEIGTRNTIGQVEGVSFFNENNLFITNELYGAIGPRLYYLDISTVQ